MTVEQGRGELKGQSWTGAGMLAWTRFETRVLPSLQISSERSIPARWFLFWTRTGTMQKSLSEKKKLARVWFGEGDLPQGWQWIKLGNACEINPRRPKGFDRADDKPTTFIPMGAVNATCGMVDRPQICPYREIKKGYTFFSDGDVLFAKITPCMQNGKHFIAGNSLDGVGFASTEFHVLRPGDSLLAEWVHFYLRQPAILKEATYHFTGTAGQQRVPDSFLKELSIPSPSLPEQKRVVAVLNKQMAAVEKARGAALERVDAVRALPSAWLREVFSFGGGGLPRGWRWEKLGSISEVISGQSPPSYTYRKSPEGLPFFQGKADFGPKNPVARVYCVAPKKIALPGDILIGSR